MKKTLIKKKPVHTPEELQRALLTSLDMKHLQLILLKGKEEANGRFPVHTGLMAKLIVNYQTNNEESFFSTLKLYLEQAAVKLPHVPSREKIPSLLSSLKTFVDDYGFQPVALYLVKA